jgi:hypothetical protein
VCMRDRPRTGVKKGESGNPKGSQNLATWSKMEFSSAPLVSVGLFKRRGLIVDLLQECHYLGLVVWVG